MISICNLVLLCLSNVLLTICVRSEGCYFPPDENVVESIQGINDSVVIVSFSTEKVGNIYILHPMT